MSKQLAYHGELYMNTLNEGYIKVHMDTFADSVNSGDGKLTDNILNLENNINKFKDDSIMFKEVNSPFDIYK